MEPPKGKGDGSREEWVKSRQVSGEMKSGSGRRPQGARLELLRERNRVERPKPQHGGERGVGGGGGRPQEPKGRGRGIGRIGRSPSKSAAKKTRR